MLRPYLLGAAGLVFGQNVRVTVDGDSIDAGYSTAPIATLLAARPALSGATFATVAISGQTWAAMSSAATDVDASITTPGKINILVCGEGTNSSGVAGGFRDGPGIVADATSYIAARKAANPKVIIILRSALPRSPSDANNAVMNTALNYSDAHYAVNWRTVGATRFANMRGIPAFAHDGFSLANFQAYESMWASADGAGGTGIYVHPSPTGVAAMVDRIEAALLSIRANECQIT